MRAIHIDEIINNIKEMCIEANYKLASDVEERVRGAREQETSGLGRQIIGQLVENLDIAKNDSIPICQDTGMAVVFMKLGQEVHIHGGSLEAAVNEGIRRGYEEGYLRKSIVSDPLIRKNTGDNTPGILHIELVPGEVL